MVLYKEMRDRVSKFGAKYSKKITIESLETMNKAPIVLKYVKSNPTLLAFWIRLGNEQSQIVILHDKVRKWYNTKDFSIFYTTPKSYKEFERVIYEHEIGHELDSIARRNGGKEYLAKRAKYGRKLKGALSAIADTSYDEFSAEANAIWEVYRDPIVEGYIKMRDEYIRR